jgi:hypothetical protein
VCQTHVSFWASFISSPCDPDHISEEGKKVLLFCLFPSFLSLFLLLCDMFSTENVIILYVINCNLEVTYIELIIYTI